MCCLGKQRKGVGGERRMEESPTTNGWHAKMEAQSEYVRVAHTFVFFCTRFGTDVHAQSVIVDEIFRVGSSVGSLLRVRCWLGRRRKQIGTRAHTVGKGCKSACAMFMDREKKKREP